MQANVYDPVREAYDEYVKRREAFEAVKPPFETEEQQKTAYEAYCEMERAEKAYRYELWAEDTATTKPW